MISPALAISPELVQSWAGAVAASCGAILGVSGVSALIYVNLPKGRAAFVRWWHETTGAGLAISEVQGLRGDVRDLGAALQSMGQLQTDHHNANAEKARLQDKEMVALGAAQEKQAQATKSLTDELTLEAEARQQSMELVSENLSKVATMADTALLRVDRHERSRTKHPPPSRRKKETAA